MQMIAEESYKELKSSQRRKLSPKDMLKLSAELSAIQKALAATVGAAALQM